MGANASTFAFLTNAAIRLMDEDASAFAILASVA